MEFKFSLPSLKESIIVVGITVLFLALTMIFIGVRPEHFILAAAFLLLFFTGVKPRKLAVGLLPFFIFGLRFLCLCPSCRLKKFMRIKVLLFGNILYMFFRQFMPAIMSKALL